MTTTLPGESSTVADVRPRYGAAPIPRSASLLSPLDSLTGPPTLTERDLTALWRGQRFPQGALVTRAGVPVRVIYQGRAGRGPGPDFRRAVIAGPSGLPLRGDVELHVRASSFRAHGHHADAAYAGVILHVVFEDDDGADTALPGGGVAPVIALAPWVARRAGELQRWLEQPLLWREPCHDAVRRLGVGGAGAALEAEGERRFAAKTARVAAAVRASGLDQALYEGLLEALGYGGNAAPMLALARLLPWQRLRERATGGAFPGGCPTALHPGEPSAGAGMRVRFQFQMESLLLGSAGLLPSQRGHRGPVEAYADRAERAFAAAGLPALPQGIWKLWGVRPANFPARRIAAAAALLAGLGEPPALLRALDATTANGAIAPFLAARASGYWLHHHDLCAGASRMPPAYIGRSRAIEILINAVLPAACASGDAALEGAARALFAKLPRAAVYGVTRYLEEALASEGVRVPVNARRAHGLLALNRDWCTQGGCGRCPLSQLESVSIQPVSRRY